MWGAIITVIGLLIFATVCVFVEQDKKLFLPALCFGAIVTIIVIMVGIFILYIGQYLSTGGLLCVS